MNQYLDAARRHLDQAASAYLEERDGRQHYFGNNILDSESGDCDNIKLEGGSGPFPYHRGLHLIAKLHLHVFADESGIHDTATWCLVTGFIGAPGHWEALEREWQKVLDEYEVGDFHSTEFFGRKSGDRIGRYQGWPDEKASGYLDALLSNIQGHELYPIGGAVNVADFNNLTYGERRLLTGGNIGENGYGKLKWLSNGAPSKPYFAAFQMLLLEAVQNTEDGAKVNFVFDQQNVLEGGGVVTFKEMQTMIAPVDPLYEKLGLISYGSRKDHIGLQAADLHTYGWHSHLTRGTKMTPELAHVMQQLTKRRNYMKTLGAEGLEQILPIMPPKDRDFVRSTRPPVKNKKGKS